MRNILRRIAIWNLTRSPAQRKRLLWVGVGLLLVSIGGQVWLDHYRAQKRVETTYTSQVSNIEQLISDFETLAFNRLNLGAGGLEVKRAEQVQRWSQDIPWNLFASLNAEQFHKISSVALELSLLTGLRIERPEQADDSRLVFGLADGPVELKERVTKILGYFSFSISEDAAVQVADRSRCIAGPIYAGEKEERIAFAFVVINVPTDNRMTGTCIPHEFLHAIGLSGHLNSGTASIMTARFSLEDLTINDKIFVRTLYDPRITPGMPREEAMEQARIIIPELVAAVKERGAEALYQR